MNVVIVGANRGIGLALVQKYLQKGASVWAVCRNLSHELEMINHSALTILSGIDVTIEHSRDKMREELPSIIDHFVHNAGVLERNTIHDIDAQSITRQFIVNSLAPLQTITTCLNKFQNGSKVGIITSRMGSMSDNTSGSHYGYRMSKAAVNMAGVSLAQDLSPQGIGVYLLHPGYVRTDMTGDNGFIEPSESAEGLVTRMYELSIEQSGSFWHCNGEVLPW